MNRSFDLHVSYHVPEDRRYFTQNQRDFGVGNVDPYAVPSTSTLFLGDLSVNCDEESLFQLFCQFGEIETIQLKKSDRDRQRAHLGFGFIKFVNRDSAEGALNALNGYFFLGRAIRVGWAEDFDKRNHQLRLNGGKPSNSLPRAVDPKKNRQTAQIHVSFISRDLNLRVSEFELGDVFGRFGNLMDIAIKKNAINPELHVQSGYAFIHYSLTEEGVRSAIMAVEQTNNHSYDHISYQSKITHSLQAHIFSMKYNASEAQHGFTQSRLSSPMSHSSRNYNGIPTGYVIAPPQLRTPHFETYEQQQSYFDQRLTIPNSIMNDDEYFGGKSSKSSPQSFHSLHMENPFNNNFTMDPSFYESAPERSSSSSIGNIEEDINNHGIPLFE